MTQQGPLQRIEKQLFSQFSLSLCRSFPLINLAGIMLEVQSTLIVPKHTLMIIMSEHLVRHGDTLNMLDSVVCDRSSLSTVQIHFKQSMDEKGIPLAFSYV